MRPSSNGPGWRTYLLFFGRFLKNPRAIGAIAPSSVALAQAMLRTFDPTRDLCTVELGPGTGVFTAALASRLGPSSRVMTVDREPVFAERLLEQWPHIDSVCGSAADLPVLAGDRQLLPIDFILSGLPFASLPGHITRQILDGIEQTLRPGGLFTTFQYVHAYPLPAAVMFRADLTRRMGALPERELVLRNFPPAYVLRWRRHAGAGDAPGRRVV